jgi:hypothetical protein
MPREKRKTYGRFLGTIFSGGVRAMLETERQRVTDEKDPKKWEKAKNNCFLTRPERRFSAKSILPSREGETPSSPDSIWLEILGLEVRTEMGGTTRCAGVSPSRRSSKRRLHNPNVLDHFSGELMWDPNISGHRRKVRGLAGARPSRGGGHKPGPNSEETGWRDASQGDREP